jgi:hypothetical protein
MVESVRQHFWAVGIARKAVVARTCSRNFNMLPGVACGTEIALDLHKNPCLLRALW